MSWLALRSASRSYLHLFNKIGTGDVEKLVFEINEERKGPSTGPKQEEEAPDGLSEKGDADIADVEMKAEDVKTEPAEVSIPVDAMTSNTANENSDSMVIDTGVEEKPSTQEQTVVTPANAMEVDPVPTDPVGS